VNEPDSCASRQIHRAARTMALAGGEIEAARVALDDIASDTKDAPVRLQGRPELTKDHHDISEWVSIVTIDSYELQVREEGRRRKKGVASYIFDLGLENGVAARCEKAVVIVAWASDHKDPWAFDGFTVPEPQRWTKTDTYDAGWLEVVAGGVVTCHDAEGLDGWWYALPLDALNSKSDIEDLLVKPVVAYAVGRRIEDTVRPLMPHLIPFEVAGGRLELRDASPSA